MISVRAVAMPLSSRVLRRTTPLSRCYASSVKGNEPAKQNNYPTIESTKSLPSNFRQMKNDTLVVLASLDIKEAREEMLKRNIMSVDNVEYEEAEKVFHEIKLSNRKGMSTEVLPYRIGIYTATVSGFASFPLIYHEDTVKWFNENFVTTDIPCAADLETPLEVGSWAWNWMEPPLGQISFFLLCLQFTRGQMLNLGIRPYTNMMRTRRAERLAKDFPQYDADIVKGYSMVEEYVVPNSIFY